MPNNNLIKTYSKRIDAMIIRDVFKHLVVVATISTSLCVFAQDDSEPPAQLVEVDTVNEEMITARIWLPGTVLSVTDSELSSEVAGRINWMANVGDRLTVGEPLVKLDAQRLEISLSQNQADIAKWEARVNLLETRVKRFNSMAVMQNTSADALDEVTAELQIARQELAQAKANFEMTEYQIEQSEVIAPFDVLVVERIQSPGEYTGVGQRLLRVVDPTQVEASVRAPLSVIPYLSPGMDVPVKDAESTLVQKISSIVPVGNARSRMMEIRVELEAKEVVIGGAVRVGLPNSSAHEGQTVPRDALVLRKSGTFVYQIDDENHAQRVAVTTGAGLGERIEVMGPLVNGRPVVVRGAERLKTGDKVRFSEDKDALVAKAF
jgi:RND family efflux transporter MFP subunit